MEWMLAFFRSRRRRYQWRPRRHHRRDKGHIVEMPVSKPLGGLAQADCRNRNGANEAQQAKDANGTRALQGRRNQKQQRQDDDHQVEPRVAYQREAVWRQHALADVFRTEGEPHDPVDRGRRLSKSDARRTVLDNQRRHDQQGEERQGEIRRTFEPLEGRSTSTHRSPHAGASTMRVSLHHGRARMALERMPELLILSRKKAEAYKPSGREACISITDVGDAPLPALSSAFVAVLRVAFSDIDEPSADPSEVLFNDTTPGKSWTSSANGRTWIASSCTAWRARADPRVSGWA